MADRTVKPASKPAIDKAIANLKRCRQLGLDCLEACEAGENYMQGLGGFAEAQGVSRSVVEEARSVALAFGGEVDFRRLLAIRRPNGMPHGPKHAFVLSRIKNEKLRWTLAKKAAAENWSLQQLFFEVKPEIRRRHPKRSGSIGAALVGRKPVIAETLDGRLNQIVKQCRSWRKWYRQLREAADGQLPADVQGRLDRLDKFLARLQADIQARRSKGARKGRS